MIIFFSFFEDDFLFIFIIFFFAYFQVSIHFILWLCFVSVCVYSCINVIHIYSWNSTTFYVANGLVWCSNVLLFNIPKNVHIIHWFQLDPIEPAVFNQLVAQLPCLAISTHISWHRQHILRWLALRVMRHAIADYNSWETNCWNQLSQTEPAELNTWYRNRYWLRH